MVEIFGDFIEDLPPGHDYLDIGFSAHSRPIQQRWRNNLLSAYFVADYLSTFIPISDDDPGSDRRKEECKSAVSFITNELLENAMKYSTIVNEHPVSFGIQFIEGSDIKIVLFVTNTITLVGMKQFQTFIHELLISDPAELYIQQLEKSAEDENAGSSGVGFLTMINDYAAKLGWKFSPLPDHPEILAVTTMVQITI